MMKLGIAAVLIVAGWYGGIYFLTREPIKVQEAVSVPAPEPVSETSSVPLFEQELLNLTNADRAGLRPLEYEPRLAHSALLKCQDMLANGYWAHDPPGPKGTWDTFPDGYFTLGENLARGYNSLKETEEAWMASSAHRENILGNFRDVGFAKCGDLTVAHFGL